MEACRELVFERIEDVMPEVDRLLPGHATCGAWTLGQILHHLSTSIRLSLATGSLPPESSTDPELQRRYEIRRRRFFQSGRFPQGVEAPIELPLPPVDADEHVEAESLRASLSLLESAEATFIVHPVLGPMSTQEWVDFHRMHCAHHLGFARVVRPV